jgi:hypothetical protein
MSSVVASLLRRVSGELGLGVCVCITPRTQTHIRAPGFPAFRKRGLETLTSYPHEGFVGDGVHADEQRILVNVCVRYKSIAAAAKGVVGRETSNRSKARTFFPHPALRGGLVVGVKLLVQKDLPVFCLRHFSSKFADSINALIIFT